jgi:hypothetical protein
MKNGMRVVFLVFGLAAASEACGAHSRSYGAEGVGAGGSSGTGGVASSGTGSLGGADGEGSDVGGADAAGGDSGLGGEAGAAEGFTAGAGGEAITNNCGNGRMDPGEECDQGSKNAAGAYGPELCTSGCKVAPYCGDEKRNGAEVCDEGGVGVELGACNPECNGFFEKKYIRPTSMKYAAGDLGGVAGADAKCVVEHGAGWKALIVGGSRRATRTPLLGDAATDWVIHKYTHYYNFENKLLWRTDKVPLLGVRDGLRVNVYSDAFQVVSEYPWSGWRADWTTFADDVDSEGTCAGWTSTVKQSASFAFANLMPAASESCSTTSFLLCVEQ